MDEEIKEVLKKNLELTQDTHRMVKKINKFIIWQQVIGVIKILLIIVPLVAGFIYLPGLLKNALEPYKELLEVGQEGQEIKLDKSSVLEMLKK